MNKIKINTSSSYEVIIGKDIISNTGMLLNQVKNPCKAVIITDETVDKLYEKTLKNSLEDSGYSVLKFVFSPGENSKTLTVAGEILDYLAQNQVSKSDILIALGGGVVGDITGFCASIYLRGIDFIQVPTTILAAVDSSVGGKTAVDLPTGKNLVGAFHNPILVVCDTNTFETLQKDVYIDGLCEVIKYGCILDKNLFDLLSRNEFDDNIEEIVNICVKLKADIVCEDEFDTGIRQILNFGHTIGHGIESLSNYKISHGKAVAMGMYMIEKAAGSGYDVDIKNVLDIYGIETISPFTGKEIALKSKNDKKVRSGNITLILLEEIGKAKLLPISIDEIEEFFQKGE